MENDAIKIWVGACSAIVLFGVLIFAGHQFGWWLRADSAHREGQVNRGSYGFQQAHRDELTSEIGQVYTITSQITGTADTNQAAGLRAQRKAVLAQACRTASQITDPLPSDQAEFVAANCSAGAPNPASPNAN